MPSPGPGSTVVRFCDVELDLRSGELMAGGHRVLLADQPFRLLALLIRARGQVVSREELRRELWSDDTFVDFELSLNAAVRRLREALGDSAAAPRFIQTLPRRGYRFIAEVAELDPAAPEPTAPPAAGRAGEAAEPGIAPPTAGNGGSVTTRARTVWWWTLAALAVTAAALVLRPAPGPSAKGDAPRTPRVTRITDESTVAVASLSPDGTEVAYVCVDGTQESLWLRRIGSAAPIQLVGPADGTFRSVSYGPDGFVYYTFFQPDRTHVALYRVSTRGGDPVVVTEASGALAFSPDGRRRAQTSSVSMGLRESRVIVSGADGGATRVAAVRTPPLSFVRTRPAWSPDGRYLAIVGMDDRRPLARELIALDVQTGQERRIATMNVSAIDAVAWPAAPTADYLVVSARDRRALPLRLWRVAVASGERQPLTEDTSDYMLAGLSGNGQRAVAVRSRTAWTLWTAPLTDPAAARQLAAGDGGFDLMEGVAWAPNGEIVFADAASGNLDLWRLDPDTGTRVRMTSDPADDFHPAVSPDGRTVIFASTRSGTSAIWATPIDAERARRLTTGGDRWPSWSPDGRWVVFQRGFADTAIEAVWRVPIDGGDAERIGPPHSFRPVVSPDARAVAHYWMNPEQWSLAITAMGSALPTRALPISRTHGMRVVRWSPDGSALAYIDGGGGVANIWLQPLDGRPPRRLTDLPDGTIATFDWSRDGTRLAWLRVEAQGDVVAVELD